MPGHATALRCREGTDLGRWRGVVPLARVLDEVRPAYGGETWPEAFTLILRSPAEAAVVAALVRRMRTDGLFDEPVVIDPDELRLLNGMHRVTAAWVSGSGHVRVSDDYPETAHEEYIDVRFTLTAPVGGWPSSLTTDDADELDYLTDWLRSFPIGAVWVEQVFAGMRSGVCQATWLCPHALTDQLMAELERRCARDRVTLRALRVVPFVGDNFPD